MSVPEVEAPVQVGIWCVVQEVNGGWQPRDRNLFSGEKCATNDAKIATRKPCVPEHERYSSTFGARRPCPRQESRRPCPKRAEQHHQEQGHERHQTSQIKQQVPMPSGRAVASMPTNLLIPPSRGRIRCLKSRDQREAQTTHILSMSGTVECTERMSRTVEHTE